MTMTRREWVVGGLAAAAAVATGDAAPAKSHSSLPPPPESVVYGESIRPWHRRRGPHLEAYLSARWPRSQWDDLRRAGGVFLVLIEWVPISAAAPMDTVEIVRARAVAMQKLNQRAVEEWGVDCGYAAV